MKEREDEERECGLRVGKRERELGLVSERKWMEEAIVVEERKG